MDLSLSSANNISDQHFCFLLLVLRYRYQHYLNFTLSLITNTMHMRVCAPSCLTLRDPMDWSLLGSLVHGSLQARILEWVAISSARDLPNLGTEPMSLMSSGLAGGFCTSLPAKPSGKCTNIMNSHQIWEFSLGCFSHEGFLVSIPLLFSLFINFCAWASPAVIWPGTAVSLAVLRHEKCFQVRQIWICTSELPLICWMTFADCFNFSVKMESISFARSLWELNELSHGSMTPDMKETLS